MHYPWDYSDRLFGQGTRILAGAQERLSCLRHFFALVSEFPRLTGLLLNAWLEENGVPSFAKEGWTRPKERCREASFEQERTGWLFQATAYSFRTICTIGGLKQPPRLRRKERDHFLYGAATPPSRRRGISLAQPFPNLDSSAVAKEGTPFSSSHALSNSP